jgi:hypothetical protein
MSESRGINKHKTKAEGSKSMMRLEIFILDDAPKLKVRET